MQIFSSGGFSGVILLIRDFVLFMLMGSGANFVLPTALVQQIPYFEDALPEKECIATYMNLMTSMGLLTMLTYLYVNAYVWTVPYSLSVPSMLLTSAVTSFVVALTYNVTVDKVSLLLYVCCFVGGSVGALSSVIMNPFMTQFQNNYISAIRSGGSGFVLLCALIATSQDPGTSEQRFSSRIYLCIIGALLSTALPAYYFITRQQLGRRGTQPSDHELGNENMDVENVRHGAEPADATGSVNPILMTGPAASVQTFDAIDKVPTGAEVTQNNQMRRKSATSIVGYDLAPLLDNFISSIISNDMHRQYPWLRRAVPYMLVVGWINFNTWGILSAMIPFSISNAYNSNGSGKLGIALQVGAVLLVLGDLSTTLFQLKLLHGVLVFTIFCMVLYIAALNAPGFHSNASGPIVIILFAIVRFVESHLVTVSLRAIATDFPLVHRETASRTLGIANQICTTLGAVCSTIVVYFLFSC